MSELLLELFSEEIPATMQKNAAEGYKTIFTTILQENEITTDVKVYIGPRRIAIHITNLPEFIAAKEIEIRGPKITATQAAIDGFCRSNNISPNDLVQSQSHYIMVKKTLRTDISDLLQDIIPKAISMYTWPNSMYWGSYDISWIRPLKNILCIFNGKLLAIKYGHLTANNITFGHRFISPESIVINSFSDYQTKLRKSYVVISQDERKQLIQDQLLLTAKPLNLSIKDDEKLLEEVTGLVEFPVVMLGRIPEKFLILPSEALVSSMRTHQKYFATFDQDGNFAPYFLFVSNMQHDKDIIIAGNEKVLSARLSDALYFYNQDLSNSLESKLPKLEQITFHAKLGSLRDKTERLAKICYHLMPENHNLQIAARLCKSDLTSEMVGEFPELQGIMGYHYAKAEGLDHKVAIAIRDHYKPQGPSDRLPTKEGAILALADKIDSIVGLILAGTEISSSRDPYSLRRQALGIIRIILETKLNINLKELVIFTANLQIIKEEKFKHYLIELIISFLEERAKYYFKTQHDIVLIDAVLDLNIEGNLNITEKKLLALKHFLAGTNGGNLLIIYKRAHNILAGNILKGEVNESAFISKYEHELFFTLQNISNKIDHHIIKGEFTSALDLLINMVQPINNFFENLMVNDADQNIATNRLLLLQMVTSLFDKLAKFNLL